MNPLLELDLHPVVAHRGASAYAPENTLPAFQLALGQQADACELDVHLSADGVPVVIHDRTLERTTDRRGAVAAMPLASLQEADAGYWFSTDGARTFPFRGRGVRIPTLVEVLEALPWMPVIIEIKAAAAMESVARVIRDLDAQNRCVVASFDERAMPAFRAAPFIAGASRADLVRILIRTTLGMRCARGPYRALAVPPRRGLVPVFSRRLVANARRIGCPVHVWTVDDPADARRFWAAGAAGIITNAPDVIRKARSDCGLRGP